MACRYLICPTGVSSVDRLDGLALVGLALLNWGLWWIWPPLAPLVTGLVILAAVRKLLWPEVKHGTDNEPDGASRNN